MTQEITLCGRCNRKLKDQKSIDRQFGPVCYKKHLQEQAEEEILKNQITIDEVEEAS
ncbi:DUF6011 domain-containing protein [Oceanobacillus sp. J11TS1]|uniref:DUF6011 domain-containing protein n=1 Tax=Oceanobacillus sp. J11TS1 TaxID=2807191 RepID=UPI001B2A0762|nr:DUF6011 domain-containing protein [Oceanobacillus sp. J11TS1]GIO25369.1 hypothetical protein J11TS1_39500 [Oceanobacillus sp. J11TS1]